MTRCVYVAGKLNADAVTYLQNVHDMIRVSNQIRKLGHSVFVPCLDLLCGLVAGGFTYSDYADNNMKWLERADVLFVLPNSEKSHGTQREIQRAVELGIPVVTDLEQLACPIPNHLD
jgi:hypothetical protein